MNTDIETSRLVKIAALAGACTVTAIIGIPLGWALAANGSMMIAIGVWLATPLTGSLGLTGLGFALIMADGEYRDPGMEVPSE